MLQKRSLTTDMPFVIEVLSGSDEPDNYFEAWYTYVNTTRNFVISSINTGRGTPVSWGLRKTITFKTVPNFDFINSNRVYQPTQNWISMEYTICEVMGWVGWLGIDGIGFQAERKSLEVRFYPYNNSTLAVQSQLYNNHRYANGNLLSYTYADGVLQKNTWICK